MGLARTPLKVVKPDERPPTPAELALEEIQAMRCGLVRLEALTGEILRAKRSQLDRLETAIRAASGEELPDQVA